MKILRAQVSHNAALGPGSPEYWATEAAGFWGTQGHSKFLNSTEISIF